MDVHDYPQTTSLRLSIFCNEQHGDSHVGKNIDELADKRAGGYDNPGERFKDSFLHRYPRSQWPSYIDTIAIDISDDIGIGSTNLDRFNFPEEVGPYYVQGIAAATGEHSDIEAILDETVTATDLGTIAFQLNELSYQIQRQDTGLEDVYHALEAVLEKLLTQETGIDLSTTRRDDTGSVADIVMELFSDDTVAREAETLVEEFERSVSGGLLARLDEPQMMTPLWSHQRDALEQWVDAGFRGYADMATATGKTVLGLAAVALRYGHLHPIDDLEAAKTTSEQERILIVAHSDLILEQWRREFDRHLNIPEERTRGSDDIDLTWGTIHFRTPQRLRNQSQYPYDLVVLDEAHHYATGQGWGELLDHFDKDVIALSGSVDDAGTDSDALRDRLRAKVGPQIKRYSITDAQSDGIIPAFDWEVRYAPLNADAEFETLSQSVHDDYQAFRGRVASAEIETERRLVTFDDIRSFSHTSAGKDLKQNDESFRSLATGLFSRRTKRWHLSPSLDAITEVVVDHRNDHVIVLVDSNAQVQVLGDQIAETLPQTTVELATTDETRAELRDRLDDFDDAENGGVLIGTGDLLGEGVDIPAANVAVNMATGGVNAQLVQRIGRILRNPTGDKHAHFYNVVGIPSDAAAIPAEDGRRVIEQAAEFCALGARFNNLPGFGPATTLDLETLTGLLTSGSQAFTDLETNHEYQPPDDPVEAEHLQALRKTIDELDDSDAAAILGEWSQYTWLESAVEPQPVVEKETQQTATTTLTVQSAAGTPLHAADVTVDAGYGQQATLENNGSGEWLLTLEGEGEATVEISHPDHQPWTTSIITTDAPDTLTATLIPVQTPPGFELTFLTDQDTPPEDCQITIHTPDGDPVADASISVTGRDAVEFLTTDEHGVAVIPGQALSSEVRIAARHREHGVRTGELALPTDANLQLTLEGAE